MLADTRLYMPQMPKGLILIDSYTEMRESVDQDGDQRGHQSGTKAI